MDKENVVNPYNRTRHRQKGSKLLIYATVWMNLKIISLSGKNKRQTKVDIPHNLIFIKLLINAN